MKTRHEINLRQTNLAESRFASSITPSHLREVEVALPCGILVGSQSLHTGLIEFRGIPYAESPTGGRRFQPPTPKAPFRVPFHANKFSPASSQVFDSKEAKLREYEDGGSGEPAFVGVEDSLSLNVWTQGCDSRSRPVIVYLHGGANWLESSRLSTYSGAPLSQRGDVVVVTLNYRLGLLGALDLTILGGAAPHSAHANCVRDQLCAIDWVRTNIHALGGDPNNITLVGESAGSMDISWMIAAGELKNRVRRVVMMSGVGSVVGFGNNHKDSVHALSEGQRRAKAFLDRLGVRAYEELQNEKMENLLERCATVAQSSDILFDMDTLFYPRVDHYFSNEDPFSAAHRGAAEGLDIMIGFTGYELGLWLTWDEQLDKRSADWAAQVMPFLPDHLRKEMAALYRRALSHETDGVQGMHLLSDGMFGAPSLIFADAAARNNSKVWMYRFDYPSTDLRRGALHAGDMCSFLGTWDTEGGRALLGMSADRRMYEERERLSFAMQDSLIAFARNGNPNTKMLPTWPEFTPGKQHFMRFDQQSDLGTAPLGSRGDFWLNKIAKPVLNSPESLPIPSHRTGHRGTNSAGR